MKVDLHIHTTISGDSIIEPDSLVQNAINAGLDGICITEHSIEKSAIAGDMAKKYNFPVFGGMEASTELGDVLIFGIDKYPRIISKAVEIREYVENMGGVMIAAHPFRRHFYRSSSNTTFTLDEACKLKILKLVDAMEYHNGWSTADEVDLCLKVGKMLNLKGTGGSDAHIPRQIGCCYTIFENKISSVSELVEEIKKGRFRSEDTRPPELKGPLSWFRNNS